MLLAGIDIGNSTTEIALASLNLGELTFLNSLSVPTSGIKGTDDNLINLEKALIRSLKKTGHQIKDLEVVFINEATPVIGDLAMATITETVITESAMIGHNPGTPGGCGIGSGKTVPIEEILLCGNNEKIIAVIAASTNFVKAAILINKAFDLNINVQGVIVEKNEGVLIANRLKNIVPIVDEVTKIEKVPLYMPAVVEVAKKGKTISELCNPYGLATYLDLNAEETKNISPIAISLIGNRSAVVIKTPEGQIKSRTIPAGKLVIVGDKGLKEVNITAGSAMIMESISKIGNIVDVTGEAGTVVGGMLNNLKATLGRISEQGSGSIKVTDIFAVDTIVPGMLQGGIAGEVCQNCAIGLAAMVWSGNGFMNKLVKSIEDKLKIEVSIGGTEIHLAIEGALTTPGVCKPLAVLDMGAGSIDAGVIDQKGEVKSIHIAGAGELVTRIIDSELGLNNRRVAEKIKRNPAARVESLFSIKTEDGGLQIFDCSLDPALLGKTIILEDNGTMLPLDQDIPLTKLVRIRQEAKRKVFIDNSMRALKSIVPTQNLRLLDRLMLIGGCALDFEIPNILSEYYYHQYGIVTGIGNIRGTLGPRNAVATGLVLAGSKCSK